VAAVSAQDWAAAAGKKVQVKSNKDEQFVLTLITTAVAIRMPEYHFLGKALQHAARQAPGHEDEARGHAPVDVGG
jgi:hypothetical protein